MLENFIFKRTSLGLMHKSLDAYSLRQKAIANNIANISTRSYQRKLVNFEDQLQEALYSVRLSGERTNSTHISLGKGRVEDLEAEVFTPEDEFSNGINNVNIDEEMMELSKVQIQNTFISRKVSGLFANLQAGITGQYNR
jgi:flagellar basal-body rod protein FlgB